jgi:high frequency lysogenization protein
MIKTISNQAIALAGLSQAVYLVQQIAKRGAADEADLETSIRSVLKIDADDVLDVYGGRPAIATGLKLLEKQLGGRDSLDPEQARYAASLIFLENKLARQPDLLEAIRRGIENVTKQTEPFPLLHENVFAGLAEVYQNTVSRLTPQIVVSGEKAYLGNPANANRIRSLLLAGIRSVVLWRQCGGSRWTFLFQRGKLQKATRELLQGLG